MTLQLEELIVITCCFIIWLQSFLEGRCVGIDHFLSHQRGAGATSGAKCAGRWRLPAQYWMQHDPRLQADVAGWLCFLVGTTWWGRWPWWPSAISHILAMDNHNSEDIDQQQQATFHSIVGRSALRWVTFYFFSWRWIGKRQYGTALKSNAAEHVLCKICPSCIHLLMPLRWTSQTRASTWTSYCLIQIVRRGVWGKPWVEGTWRDDLMTIWRELRKPWVQGYLIGILPISPYFSHIFPSRLLGKPWDVIRTQCLPPSCKTRPWAPASIGFRNDTFESIFATLLFHPFSVWWGHCDKPYMP